MIRTQNIDVFIGFVVDRADDLAGGLVDRHEMHDRPAAAVVQEESPADRDHAGFGVEGLSPILRCYQI